MFQLSSLYAMLASSLGVSATPERTYRNSRPTGAALRNPADPTQAARIEAAAVKRARRAEKLTALMSRATLFNRAHQPNVWNDVRQNLNPFYVAK